MKTALSSLGTAYIYAWREALSLFGQFGEKVTELAIPRNPARKFEKCHGKSKQAFDLEQKKKWDGVRFGQLSHTCLGDLSS